MATRLETLSARIAAASRNTRAAGFKEVLDGDRKQLAQAVVEVKRIRATALGMEKLVEALEVRQALAQEAAGIVTAPPPAAAQPSTEEPAATGTGNGTASKKKAGTRRRQKGS